MATREASTQRSKPGAGDTSDPVLVPEGGSQGPASGRGRWVKAAPLAAAFEDHRGTRPPQGFGAAIRSLAGTGYCETYSIVGRDVEMASLDIADEGGIGWRIAA